MSDAISEVLQGAEGEEVNHSMGFWGMVSKD